MARGLGAEKLTIELGINHDLWKGEEGGTLNQTPMASDLTNHALVMKPA